ncbi:aminoacyl-tRNA hydrolase [Eremococcus coleocola]|uniref:Peptidyl-tRNA hydrolase n=1 Tax=Eremococcus coleocola ACS-139-V-Col8 TaxID=908337 RepID=E4KMU2_9LACT|nr:aminoacyl-tRNA hydrolase [Eremococcus coleocola]EFR31693.1 aminoacyl-tRNA hydrolase [Eremococcus coleocola ACS-139-V-Col8]
MKLFVGLGNPGEKYEATRHNVGFAVIDQFMQDHGLAMTKQKFRADYEIWHSPKEKVLLLKPFTYMNASGEAVLPIMSYYGIGMEDLVVVYDDLDLDPGRIRLRQKGSSGGHNGMKSIISILGSDQFNRIRVGIGRPHPGWKVVDHVLAPFDKTEQVLIDQAVGQAASALTDYLDNEDFIQTMNKFN